MTEQVDLGRIAICRHDYDGDYVTVYETSGNGVWSAAIRADELARLLVRLLEPYRQPAQLSSYREERESFQKEFGIGEPPAGL